MTTPENQATPTDPALYTGPDRATLLADYVTAGRVDDRAPTQAEGAIAIDADPELVWGLLADVTRWPQIRADVHDAETAGPAAPGRDFAWSAGPNRVRSTFGAVEPGLLLTLVSSAQGATFASVYRFEPEAPGRTRLTCRESLAGPVAAELVTSAVLQHGVDTWLAGIKALAEAG